MTKPDQSGIQAVVMLILAVAASGAIAIKSLWFEGFFAMNAPERALTSLAALAAFGFVLSFVAMQWDPTARWGERALMPCLALLYLFIFLRVAFVLVTLVREQWRP